jgi:Xaa-Pro aminopeptidase
MYTTRLATIRSLLLDQHIDAALISSPANLYYLSGFACLSPEELEALAVITKKNVYLLSSPLYAENSEAYHPGVIVKKTSAKASYTDLIAQIVKEEQITSLGVEEHNLTVEEYRELLEHHMPLTDMHLRLLRLRKDKEEIDRMQQACAIGDKAFEHVLNIIKPGITEEELALELELFVRKQHATLSFPSIIAFGAHASTPHHVSGKTILKNNQCILMDFGIKVDEYCSDMTRTVFVGKPTEEEKKVYNTVKEAQQLAIDYIQKYTTQTKASEADKIARDHIVNAGYPTFEHTLGHGIGLQVHEAPSLSTYSKDVLNNGMVFSVEPGIYLKNNMGVRIEDLMAIYDNQAILLTHSSKELIII